MRQGNLAALICALSISAITACGPHTGGGGDDDPHGMAVSIAVSPPTSELQILNGAAATEAFTAVVTYEDGFSEDVTARAVFTIDALGSFQGPELTLVSSGKTMVYGSFAEAVGTAEVIGRVKSTRVDPALPPDVDGLFGGPEDPSRAPVLVYPPANTVMPRNIGDFEVHWTDAVANDAFEVSLHTEFADVRVYVPTTTPANFTAFTPVEWYEAVGNEASVVYQVRGVQMANPTSVGAAAPQQLTLSNEEMVGGLYYWSTGSRTDATVPFGIFRHDMSKPGEPAEEFMTTDQTSGRCVACHVLSRDGSKMAVTYDGGGQPATFVDVATGAAQTSTASWNFGAFSADGNQFFSVEAGVMVLRNYADQAVIATVPTAGANASQPDVSADGQQIVYVAEPSPGTDWAVVGGQIVVQSFDQTSATFGAPRVLVADGANNFYPSFSPDGQWVLFNKATDGGTSYNDASTELWVVKADGSQPPVRLANADAAANATNSWGRWAPFAQTFGANDEPMFWVTVSSKRDFGVRLVGLGQPQIWMSPFFPDRAAAGMDPTVPMFRLPFQDINHNNHIAQWTQQIVSINAKGK
jgi:hypothetical protein